MLRKFSDLFIGDTSFYKKVLAIAIPVMIQSLIATSVQLIDNVMVGTMSEEAISAVATANQITFILVLANFGLMGGIGIFISQFFGAQDDVSLKKSFQFRLFSSVLLILLSVIFIYVFKEQLIFFFLDDSPSTYLLALEYMDLVLLSFIPYSVSIAIQMTFREVMKPNVAMFNGIIALISNTVLNYIFIFGFLNIPALGVIGAGIATILARTIECLFALYFYHKYGDKFKLKFKEMFTFDFKIYKRILKKALPLTANEIVWSTGRTILFYAYSTRGLEAISAINITTTISNVAFIAINGLATAISILLGTSLGANDLKGAKDNSRKLMFLAFMVSFLMTILLISLRDFGLSFYDINENTKMIAQNAILIYALLIPLNSINISTYFILRSGGAMKITFLIDAGFSLMVTIPSALILAEFFTVDIVTLYLITNLLEILKVIPSLYFYKKGLWINNIAVLN